MPNIMKAVQFMIDTAKDDIHGYDQTYRNGPDYDCSSLVGTALHEAGFNVSPYSWTGNIEKQLRAAGFVDCKAPWKAGDVHLKRNKHVAMSISRSKIIHASINELGMVKGGKTGDQTGKEICIRSYYEYSGGWDVHLRYVGENTKVSTKLSIDTVAKEVIAGKWGNGEKRKKLLTEAGYDYDTVKAKVNQIWYGTDFKSCVDIAREVIAGKWGNGEKRKKLITEAGYDYPAIQKIVNDMLSTRR